MALAPPLPDSGSKLKLPDFESPETVVLGHEAIRQQLAHAVAHGSFAPAYVFSGPRGVGKRTCALWFARLLLCERQPAGGAPCDACVPCRRVISGAHPDVYEVRKESDKTYIRLDMVLRPMLKAAEFAPLEGAHKIFLLSEAEYLNVAGMNALLKILEEPRKEQVFVLVVPSAGKLLPTVLSRCHALRFGALETADITEWLKHRGDPHETAALAATLSDGCPGIALGRMRDARFWEARKNALDLAAMLSSGDLSSFLGVVEKMDDLGSDKRAEIERILGFLVSWYRDLIWLQQDFPEHTLLNHDHLAALRRDVRRFTPPRLLGTLGALDEARTHMMGNANTKLLFTRLALHLIP